MPQCVRARTAAAFFSNPSSRTTCSRAPRRAALFLTIRPTDARARCSRANPTSGCAARCRRRRHVWSASRFFTTRHPTSGFELLRWICWVQGANLCHFWLFCTARLYLYLRSSRFLRRQILVCSSQQDDDASYKFFL